MDWFDSNYNLSLFAFNRSIRSPSRFFLCDDKFEIYPNMRHPYLPRRFFAIFSNREQQGIERERGTERGGTGWTSINSLDT